MNIEHISNKDIISDNKRFRNFRMPVMQKGQRVLANSYFKSNQSIEVGEITNAL